MRVSSSLLLAVSHAVPATGEPGNSCAAQILTRTEWCCTVAAFCNTHSAHFLLIILPSEFLDEGMICYPLACSAEWQLWHSAMVIGAKIYWTAAGKKRLRLKNNGGSYLSFHDPREVLGIGLAKKIDELEIHWPAPSKPIAKFTDVPVNRYIRVAETGGIRD